MPNILLTFSEINSKPKGGYWSNDQKHVNIQDNIRPVYCNSSPGIDIFKRIASESKFDISIMYQVIVWICLISKILLPFSEINSKPKGGLIDLMTRNMLTFRTTFDPFMVNRPLESVYSNELLQKVNLTYIYIYRYQVIFWIHLIPKVCLHFLKLTQNQRLLI